MVDRIEIKGKHVKLHQYVPNNMHAFEFKIICSILFCLASSLYLYFSVRPVSYLFHHATNLVRHRCRCYAVDIDLVDSLCLQIAHLICCTDKRIEMN